jgi:hypothetical protein
MQRAGRAGRVRPGHLPVYVMLHPCYLSSLFLGLLHLCVPCLMPFLPLGFVHPPALSALLICSTCVMLRRIMQASCKQRAGRVRPGHAFRPYFAS